jgi:phosphatidylglycerophosphatase A
MRTLIILLASGLGTGFAPKAPGTVGSLLGLSLFFLLSGWGPWAPVAAALVMIAAAGPLLGHAEVIFEQADSPRISYDEVAGMLVALAFLPPRPGVMALAFVFFRLFDIVKPYPISAVHHRLHGGYGVVMDDVLAGVFANIATRLALYLWSLIA